MNSRSFCAWPPCWNNHEAALFFEGYALAAIVILLLLFAIGKTSK